VHYAPQPFVDLGHGIGPNTGPLGFAERIDTADQASGPLIVFKPHCNFHALPKQKVFISGVATDPESCVQMPENKSVVYVDLTDNIAKSEHVSLSSAKVFQAKSATLSSQNSQTIPNFITDVFAQLQTPL
jgi:hypothetical protein